MEARYIDPLCSSSFGADSDFNYNGIESSGSGTPKFKKKRTHSISYVQSKFKPRGNTAAVERAAKVEYDDRFHYENCLTFEPGINSYQITSQQSSICHTNASEVVTGIKGCKLLKRFDSGEVSIVST